MNNSQACYRSINRATCRVLDKTSHFQDRERKQLGLRFFLLIPKLLYKQYRHAVAPLRNLPAKLNNFLVI